MQADQRQADRGPDGGHVGGARGPDGHRAARLRGAGDRGHVLRGAQRAPGRGLDRDHEPAAQRLQRAHAAARHSTPGTGASSPAEAASRAAPSSDPPDGDLDRRARPERPATAAAKGAVSASPARKTLPVHDSVAGSAGREHALEGGAARQGELAPGRGQDLDGGGLAGARRSATSRAKPATARVGGSARLISQRRAGPGAPNRLRGGRGQRLGAAAAVVVAQRQVEPGAADREAAAGVAQQRPGAVDLGPALGRPRPWPPCRCRRPRPRRGARRAPPGARSPRRWRWPRAPGPGARAARRRSGRRSGSRGDLEARQPQPDRRRRAVQRAQLADGLEHGAGHGVGAHARGVHPAHAGCDAPRAGRPRPSTG